MINTAYSSLYLHSYYLVKACGGSYKGVSRVGESHVLFANIKNVIERHEISIRKIPDVSGTKAHAI